MDTADPPFPRNAGYWWFGCRAESMHDSKHKTDQEGSATEYRPSLLDLRNEQNLNQNTDVGDLLMDAGKYLIHIFNSLNACTLYLQNYINLVNAELYFCI